MLKKGVLFGIFASTFAVLPAQAAENCSDQQTIYPDYPNQEYPETTGGTGTAGQSVSSANEFSESESASHDSCGATVTEGSGKQTQDVAMTIGQKINTFRWRSRGVDGKGNIQKTAFYFGGLGGAAGADSDDNALLDGSRLSFFSFVDHTKRDREATASSSGYDQESDSLTLGFDYRLDNTSFAGLSISASDGDSELDSQLGGSEVSSSMLGAHGAKYWDTHFISAFFAYGSIDIDINRLTVGDAFSASTDGDYWYGDLTFGAEYSYGSLRLSPSMRALFMSGKIDGYTERSASGGGAVRSINTQDIDSNILSLALQADYSLLQSWGVLLPSMRAEFIFDQGNAYKTNGQTLNDSDKSVLGSISDQSDEPDSSTLAISWGVSAQFKRGLATYFAYERLFLHDYLNKYTMTLGFRYELP
ncbi:autotransporter outer membrane beta-barrel domain-containing protein [Zhongshania borealis]